jgi:hypothetical protein
MGLVDLIIVWRAPDPIPHRIRQDAPIAVRGHGRRLRHGARRGVRQALPFLGCHDRRPYLLLLAPSRKYNFYLPSPRIDDGNELFHDDVPVAAKLRRDLLGIGGKQMHLDVRRHDAIDGYRKGDVVEWRRLPRDQFGDRRLLLERQKIGLGGHGLGRSLRQDRRRYETNGGDERQNHSHSGPRNSGTSVPFL